MGTILYGILYCRADDIRYLPRRLIRSLYTIHSFSARLQNALLRPSAPFCFLALVVGFFFGWVWKVRRGGGPPESPFFLVKEGFVFFFCFLGRLNLVFWHLNFEFCLFSGGGCSGGKKHSRKICDKWRRLQQLQCCWICLPVSPFLTSFHPHVLLLLLLLPAVLGLFRFRHYCRAEGPGAWWGHGWIWREKLRAVRAFV